MKKLFICLLALALVGVQALAEQQHEAKASEGTTGGSVKPKIVDIEPPPGEDLYEFYAKTRAGEQSEIIVIDFWADWCPPCKNMGRFIKEWLKPDRKGAEFYEGVAVYKVNTTDTTRTQAITNDYGVGPIPHFAILKRRGKEWVQVHQFTGQVGESQFKKEITAARQSKVQ